MSPLQRTQFRYCAFYCEENIWHLAQDARLPDGPRHVLLITNDQRRTVLFHQRAGKEGVVLWDYHVILVVQSHSGPLVFDLDSQLPFPCALADYVALSFGPQEQLPEELRARVRLLPAPRYLETFTSDRSHMKTEEGGWIQPPPDWPLIHSGSLEPWTLSQALDLTQATPGEWMSPAQLVPRLETAGPR